MILALRVIIFVQKAFSWKVTRVQWVLLKSRFKIISTFILNPELDHIMVRQFQESNISLILRKSAVVAPSISGNVSRRTPACSAIDSR